MGLRLLLDENVEMEVLHRLTNYGHDVEHVQHAPDLGKGVPDPAVAAYASTTNRIVVTYDSHFVDTIPVSDHEGVLFVPDETISAGRAADILHEVSTVLDQSQIDGVRKIGRSWL